MSEPFIGQTKLWGINYAPEKWAFCEGQMITINSNQALFSLLGTAYGGDGRTNFALPDLRGKSPISMGQGLGLPDYNIGATAGAETHTLTIAEMATHGHLASYSSNGGAVKVEASIDSATENTPGTGSYLANNANEAFYRADAGSGTVLLGGVAGGSGAVTGTVTVGNTGSSQKFNILQALQVMTYSMALQGLFPSRN